MKQLIYGIQLSVHIIIFTITLKSTLITVKNVFEILKYLNIYYTNHKNTIC